MKSIIFNRLSIKNFLSVGNEPVIINFSTGLHIITGLNKDKADRRNAVGKTTILDALNFVIFGKTVRELTKDLIVNNITNDTCEVELHLAVNENGVTKDYVICRKINPSELSLHCNGEDITTHTMVGTSALITELISCNEEVFQNCIIMSANNTTPFMAKKMVEKRKFIEGIFSLEVFSEMLSKVREDYNKTKKVCDVDGAKYEEVSNSLKNYENQRVSVLRERQSKKKTQLDQLDTNNEKIRALKDSDPTQNQDVDIEGRQQKIKELNIDIDKLDSKIQELTISCTTYKNDVVTLNDKLSKIGTSGEICDMCLRPLDGTDHAHINSTKADIKKQILAAGDIYKKLNTELTTAKTTKESKKKQITTYNEEIVKIGKVLESRKSISSAIKSLEDWNSNILKEIETLSDTKTDLDPLIETTTEKIKKSKETLDRLKSNLNMLDVVKYIVSEEGVKAFIIKKILEVFNARIAYYLKKLDSNCTCVFNEYFEEKFTNEKGKSCSYYNFSGEERKVIDLACLFTFMDIRRIQGNVAMNISIYDELLDSSVDEKGIELVLGLLKERVEKYNECVMVISHRKECGKFATGEVVFLNKQNGITTRVEYVV